MAGSSASNEQPSRNKRSGVVIYGRAVLYKHGAMTVTLNQHIASCPQYVHSSYLCRCPATDVLSPISRHLDRLRRQNLGRNHAAQDTIVRHHIYDSKNRKTQKGMISAYSETLHVTMKRRSFDLRNSSSSPSTGLGLRLAPW